MSTPNPSESTDVRERIIDAAEERFRHFGYGKTNVGEIAADVGMSAGNLYRYFDSKQDIAAACALRCMSRLDELLEPVLKDNESSAALRLQQYVLTKLRYNHDQAHHHPRLAELVETVVGERPEVVHKKIQETKENLSIIIAVGMERGEFESGDPMTVTEALFTALVFFATPTFMPLYPLETMEKMARDVVTLLINGLARRP